MVPPPSTYRISQIGGRNMSSISCARNSYVDGSPAGFRKAVQLFAVALTSATLAACAQSSAVTSKSELLSAGRQASLEDKRNSSLVSTKRVAVMTKNRAPLSADKHAAESKVSSYGLASFYSEGTRTASGEQFNPNALTAAHPNLPFGTKLRVTDVATGRSVIVRVNDRGPFVPGRVVDVSYSAAASLGIIGRGTAKVKLDVVQ
jgi:peptidoglycan lytic transglycosylase